MSWLIPESFSEDRCRRHGWWVLLALTALLYLPGLSTMPLMDRDEPRFAHATVEMMQRGSWAVPYFNSDPEVTDAERIADMKRGKGAMTVGYRFDKPPLTYWWMRLHYHLFGLNGFAARLHSVLATWLVSLVIFGLCKRLSSARAGLAAGLAWLTTLQVLVHGRLCVADMPLVLFVALACWAIVEVLVLPAEEGKTSFNAWHWTLYVSIGLGFLAKGPLAFLIPGLALVLWRFAFWRKPVEWGRLKAWPGALISLAIIAAWGIPALIETEGQFWKVGMGEHVIDRGAKAFNGRFPIPGYYLVTSLLSLFPWIALLPMVWKKVREQWDDRFAFLVSWLAAPYVIFTLYATQLPHYVMPGFPAAMVLLMACGDLGTPGKWAKRWASGCVFACLVFSLVVMSAQHAFEWSSPLGTGMAYLGDFLFVVALLALAIVLRVIARPQPYFTLAAVLLLPLTWWLLMSPIRSTHPAAQLAAKAGPLPAKVELIGWQFAEPSLVFHFNHHWRFTSKLDTVTERMDRKGPRVVVLLRREWTLSRALNEKLAGKTELTTEQDFTKEVDALIAAHPDYQVTEFTGLNAARASWAELRMLVRK